MPWFAGSPGALRAALYRGAALIGLALMLGSARALFGPRSSPVALLVGLAAGFALHGLVLSHAVVVRGPTSLALGLVAAALGVWLANRALLRSLSAASAVEPQSAPTKFGLPESLALALCGAACAFALESVARPLRLAFGGLSTDDTAFALTGLAWAALGAAAFSPLALAVLRPRHALPVLLAAGCVACLYGLQLIGALGLRDALDSFLRRQPWDLDLSNESMLGADLLIAGRCLLVAAATLGIALGSARERWRWFSVFLGAGLATCCLPFFTSIHAQSAATESAPGAIEQLLGSVPDARVRMAAWLAVGAAAAAVLVARQATPRRWIALACTLALGAWVFRSPVAHTTIASPWQRFQPVHYWAAESELGVLSVETAPGGALTATLDRKRLTPIGPETLDDEACLRLAWTTRRNATAVRDRLDSVLLVGQLTPERDLALRQLGVARIDRTATWWRHMQEMETTLFAPGSPPEGQILDPGQLTKAQLSAYALVYVPPLKNESFAPDPERLRALGAVAWLEAGQSAVAREWGDRVLATSASVRDLWIGIGAVGEEGVPGGTQRRLRVPFAWMNQRPHQRQFQATRMATERLAQASSGTPHAALAETLRELYGAQKHSSPFETEAQKIEWPQAALEHLRAAALAPAVDPGVQDLCRAAARILREKREVNWIYDYLGPVAERHPHWEELQRALIAADFETLDAARAATRLSALRLLRPLDLDLLLDLAKAHSLDGQPALAIPMLSEVNRMQPDRRDVERLLAMARARAGEANARAEIESLLLEDPDDEYLRQFLGAAPYSDVAGDYASPAADDHDHGHE